MAYVLLAVFAFSLLVAFLSWYAHRRNILITDVEFSGNALISSVDLEQKAGALLQGNYFWLFPKSNSYLFRQESFTKAMTEKFPAIESISVQKNSPTSILVSIRERSPFALWCRSELEEEMGNEGCYFMDKTGLIFSRAPEYSSDVFLTFVGDDEISVSLGSFPIEPLRFSEILFFLNSLKRIKLSVERVVIERSAGGVEDLKLVLTQGSSLLISSSQSLEATLDNVTTFFGDRTLVPSTDNFLKQIEYVDFRFGNKIYYR